MIIAIRAPPCERRDPHCPGVPG